MLYAAVKIRCDSGGDFNGPYSIIRMKPAKCIPALGARNDLYEMSSFHFANSLEKLHIYIRANPAFGWIEVSFTYTSKLILNFKNAYQQQSALHHSSYCLNIPQLPMHFLH